MYERLPTSTNGWCAGFEKFFSKAVLVDFFSAAASTFLQAGVILSLSLARQAMIRPPPGVTPLQYFS